jgi:hypothetical protein
LIYALKKFLLIQITMLKVFYYAKTMFVLGYKKNQNG